MVNGNYVLYGDRPSSGSEIVDDHVQTRTAERKSKRKANRTANELQHTLNLAQVDNETDSIKFEKKVKEPRLLRYVPTTDVEENFVTEKFETYDLPPAEQRPRRYPFTKKPKNPTDGSFNYYSRSNSSSPNGNLPTIAEHNEPFGSYRVRNLPKVNEGVATYDSNYESKLDKYFAKPRELKKYESKGSHPDSLYRVATGGSAGSGKLMQLMRTLRWPAALLLVCTALAVFVYFLMPDNMNSDSEMLNSTYWEASGLGGVHNLAPGMQKPLGIKKPETSLPNSAGKTKTKPPEVDFYDPANDKNYDLISIIDTISGKKPNKKLPVPPVFPAHLKPEVQYGNEKADTGKTRGGKTLDDKNKQAEVTTPKPHITQKPEKPFAIYLEDPVANNPSHAVNEGFKKAETSNNFNMYGRPKIGDNVEHYRPAQDLPKELPIEISPELQEYYGRIPAKNIDVSFTSGHSKFFGIGIEDAEKMKATTQSSLYNTRVSPTLPTWRDGDDSTTKNYPVNLNVDVQECRSPSLELCRGVLPYDLAGAAPTINGRPVTTMQAQFEYLVSTNCSDRARQFVCSLLEPECSPAPQPPKTPCYSLCKAVIDNCESFIDPLIAPAFRCKQYENTNCISARAPCSARELACGDGTCVPRDWMCDGTKDCPAGEDERQCTECDKTQFRCPTGSCISKRWLCDGYLDCPEGEDEAQCAGAEPGEEPAGSAPRPSVRRPNRLHGAGKQRSQVQTADDSSKELLVTSDSSNALKRNYTRRPTLARLTPYRPKPRQRQEDTINEDINEEPKQDTRTHKKFPAKTTMKSPSAQNKDSAEDVNIGDIGFLEEFDKAVKDSKNDEFVKKAPKSRPRPPQIDIDTLEKQNEQRPIIEIGKDNNKFERVLNGAKLLQKAAEEEAERARLVNQTSPEDYAFYSNKQPDPAGPPGSISPCPSGELRCVDGRCITLAQLCDGTIDCSDHADEDNCFT